MKCRSVAKVLPELVARELDDAKAKEAEDHIKSCPSCAQERARYEKALCALSEPREMIDVPEALDTLPLPQIQRRRWLRPALVSAGLAAILALLILLPRLNYAPQQGSTVAQTPQKLERTVPPPVPPPVAEHPRSVQPKRRADAKKMPERAILSPTAEKHPRTGKVAEAPLEHPMSSGIRHKRIFVIASRTEPPPEPSVIEIESTDHATGTVTVYTAITNEAGDEAIEIESRTNPTDDRRMEL